MKLKYIQGNFPLKILLFKRIKYKFLIMNNHNSIIKVLIKLPNYNSIHFKNLQ